MVLFVFIFWLIVAITVHLCELRKEYNSYVEYVETVKETKKFAYLTYKEFLQEYKDRDMFSSYFDGNSFYYIDSKSKLSECKTDGSIVFENVYILLNYKDYKKYKRFIFKEVERATELKVKGK